MKNYILEYIDKIESGEIITSARVRQMYQKIKPIVKGQDPKYYYNEKKGKKIIKFIETFCKQSKGKWAGEPIDLLLFQKAKLQAIFGIVDRETELRKYKEVFDLRGRKNGKSVENSAIALYLLVMDKEKGAEIYSAATVMAQAKRVWEESRNMVEQSKELSEVVKGRVFPSPELYIPEFKSIYKPLSKNVSTFDGLNASASTIDEVHALPRQIYDVLKQSMSTREQPLLSMITTSGFVREGLFDDTYSYAKKVVDGSVEDDHFFALLYELDNEEEMYDEKAWIKSNPAIDVIKSREDLRENVERMKSDVNFASTVKVKDFNLIDVEEKAWLTFNQLNNEQVVDTSKYNGQVAIGGLDLSRTGDLTSFTTLFYDKDLDKFVAETMYWIPEKKFEEMKHSKIPYRQWVDRGLIRVCEGNIIDYQDISHYIYQEMAIDRDITYLRIHYDAYSATYLIKDLESLGFGPSCLQRTQQGYKTLSIPMQEMELFLEEDKLIYNNNPVTKWCLSNVELAQDRNGNYMPKKINKTKERKIDGASTILNCFVGLVEIYEEFVDQ